MRSNADRRIRDCRPLCGLLPALALLASPLLAEPAAQAPEPVLVLAPLFSDHAVLQRDKADPVWGSAGPGKRFGNVPRKD